MLEINTNAVLLNRYYHVIQAGVLLVFFLPVFFQLSGQVFNDVNLFFDSDGKLLQVPLPIGSVICFLGIAVLLRIDASYFSVGFLFTVFILMCFSTLVKFDSSNQDQLSHFILLMQFVLPVFAVVLGSLYIKPKNYFLRYEALMLYIVVLIVPLELTSTWLSGSGLLAPNLFIFSLYQHLQYLPVIFVSFYLLAAFELYKQKHLRLLCIILAPIMGAYVSFSLSLSAMLLLAIGSISFVVYFIKLEYSRYALIIVFPLLVSFVVSICWMVSSNSVEDSLSHVPQYITHQSTLIDQVPVADPSVKSNVIPYIISSVASKILYWKIYFKAAIHDASKFIFGHNNRLERKQYPSAYNYYLDHVYHFGVLALLPFVFLVFYTLYKLAKRQNKYVSENSLFMLGTIMVFLIFIENNQNVGFRQPYPGMIMFFLWGVLLMQLSAPSTNKYFSKNKQL